MSLRGKEEGITPRSLKHAVALSRGDHGSSKITGSPRRAPARAFTPFNGSPRRPTSRAGSPPPRSTGTSLKAQLDSVRYPAGRQDQYRRVVTTQVTGTPRNPSHRHEGTAPAASSPVKGPSSALSRKTARIEAPSPFGRGIRPGSRQHVELPARRSESVLGRSRPPLPKSGSPLKTCELSSGRRSRSRPSSRQSESPAKGSESVVARGTTTPTPSKLKLRKSLPPMTGATSARPAKTPANSPASNRSSGVEPLSEVDNK